MVQKLCWKGDAGRWRTGLPRLRYNLPELEHFTYRYKSREEIPQNIGDTLGQTHGLPSVWQVKERSDLWCDSWTGDSRHGILCAGVGDDDLVGGKGATTPHSALIRYSCFSAECRDVRRTAWMCDQLRSMRTRDLVPTVKVEDFYIP
jgi:hypothetical protein